MLVRSTYGRPLFVLAASLACVLGEASAAPARPVSLGEIHAAHHAELEAVFRRSVERELASLDLSAVKTPERFVLSAELTELETRREDRELRATAKVTATLRRARGGELHAIVRGSATTAESARASRATMEAVVRAAARSAVRRVPEAL